MSLRYAAALLPLLALGACGHVTEHAVVSPPLSVERTLNWRASNPRPADGTTTFLLAAIDTSATRALAPYAPGRSDYPSVGGDILRGIPRTPVIDLTPIRPASPSSRRLREPAPGSPEVTTPAPETPRQRSRRGRR
jgi:hypothetical protein